MFITKECDYAVRIIRGLSKTEKATVGFLCKQENLPQFYAYKILNKLEKSGFVQSKRGSLGGYILLKDPNLITLYDIVLAVDCDAFLAGCVKNKGYCSRNTPEAPCKVHIELCRLQDKFIDCLKEKTLAQILA